MPGLSTKTPARIAKMLALHKAGMSAREIADALGGMGHTTVTNWLKDSGLKPNGGLGSRLNRKRGEVNGVAGAVAEAQQHLAELASQPAPTDYAAVLDRLRRNFALVAGLVEYHVDASKHGRSSMAELEKAIRIQDAFAVKIRELEPKNAPDPDAGPDATNAADEVMRRLMTTVQTARRAARCVHCGRNPHG